MAARPQWSYAIPTPIASKWVEDAQKYQDTAALFYLSQKSDLGLQLVEEPKGRLKFTLTPHDTAAVYSQSLTPASSYHLGVTIDGEESEAHLGATWRTVTGHTKLDAVTAEVQGSNITLSWARSNLSDDERSERLYSIASNSGDLQARFGTRWFDLFQGTDVLSEVGIDNEALVIGAQLERSLGSANGFVGAMGNLSTGNIHLTLGLRYALGRKVEINTTTDTGLASQNVQSLKSLRSAALPSHWRNSVHLGARAIDGDAPIFPTLDCLLGCYESDPDPEVIHVNNFGLPGLIDLPSAGRLPDGELVLTQQLHESLARSGMSFQLLPRLGVAFRYSGHGKNGDEANGRTNHDRSFDAHLNLREEGTYLPSLAVGLRDFIGTGWYSSEYIVGTKTYGNIAVTGGLGFGRLADRNTIENPFSVFSNRFHRRATNEVGKGGTLGTINWFQGDAAPFGGITYRHNPDLTLAAEYTPDLMRREASYLDVTSPWNVGAQYRLNDTVSLSAQYLHGSTISLGANITLNPKRSPAGAGKGNSTRPDARPRWRKRASAHGSRDTA
jgi:hypothetical protein